MASAWLERAWRAGVTRMRPTTRTSHAAARAAYAAHGVGIGARDVDGRPTSELALRVHVVQKMPRRLLSLRDRLPTNIDGLPVDVVESPPAFVCSGRERQACDPLSAGISVGRDGVTFGTLGAFCRSRRKEDGDRILMLSNRHVLAGWQGNVGDPVYQPGPGDSGTAGLRQVGTLLRSWPIEPGIIANRIDAAIATIAGPGHEFALPPGDAPIITGTASPTVNVSVCKFGRTSGLTQGFITDLQFDAIVGLDALREDLSATFVDQIRIGKRSDMRVFAEEGDSGSAILEQGTGRIVGLYFAGPLNGSFGLANHIKDITDRLDIDLLP